MYKWIEENTKYTPEMNGVQGRVYAEFVVQKNGSIKNVKILKSLSPSCDKEAERVLLSMPRWIPGQKNGNDVSVKQTIIINFRQPRR